MKDTRVDRREKSQRKKRAWTITVIVLVTLIAGVGAGVGFNFAFSDALPEGGSVKTATTTPAGISDSSGKELSSAPGPSADEADGARFDTSRAMADIAAFTDQVGPRPAGSGREATAANMVVQKLAEAGYTVDEQAFTTPDGFATRNIIGTRRGTRDGYIIVVAAHYDSAPGSKGSVDDGSGAGTVLELARAFAQSSLQPTLKFVFFGANRPGATDMDTRLLGSRRFVDLLGSMDKREIVGMIAVDCVAAGEFLALRTRETGLQRLKDKMTTYARESNLPVINLKSDHDSDNMPFEDAKMPAVWLEWCDAGGKISADDNSMAGVQAPKVEAAGKLLESFLRDLTSDDLEELKY